MPRKSWDEVIKNDRKKIDMDSVDHQNRSALRERLRTHKVFTKDHCLYLNYHKFSIKSYVLDVY